MSAAAAPSAPAPPAAAGPPVWKGAWGGAWLVVYGCVTLLARLFALASLEAAVRVLPLAADGMRVGAAKAGGDATARQLAALLARGPEALGASQRPWLLAATGVSVLTITLGVLVLRRSASARVVAILAVAGSFLLSAGVALREWFRVLPQTESWAAEFRTHVETAQRVAPEETQWFLDLVHESLQVDRGWHALSALTVLALHLALALPVTLRLAGGATRAWCAPRR